MMELLYRFALESARTLVLAAPFLLFGLLAAGLLHVLLPERLIARWMGRRGMSGVLLAALVGVPLPVCSCGVVPITVELRRKGASQPASLSFLTTTPESSVDSILLTWGLMGPVMAIARPVAAFASAVLGGALALVALPETDSRELPGASADACCGSCAAEPTAEPGTRTEPQGPWRRVLRPALRYGFVELLDDLAFWLVLGILAAGAVAALLPTDLGALGLGGGLEPMLLALVVGVPIYLCASASTPLAAALLAKGLGPGAALVFLLAGPATNVATLVLLVRTFGRRFVAIYLASVVAGALAAGLALEALVGRFGWRVDAPLTTAPSEPLELLAVACGVVLALLLAWRLARGGLASGWSELKAGFRGIAGGQHTH
ncbi:MAG: SO_0444 family Cu/Zn efflux transporter [Acidobacteria bacterium]|nr:SO_0444 family Cu/Zn efflux transporter [Acidobacteriota bacterium]